MVKISVVSVEQAQNTRKPKTPGVRRQRMNVFDEYARVLLGNPSDAAVYEDIEENPQTFILTLRGAFKRAGVNAVVRKMRDRDEVRAWLVTDAELAEHRQRFTKVRSGRRKRELVTA